jgi:hypothetical protein
LQKKNKEYDDCFLHFFWRVCQPAGIAVELHGVYARRSDMPVFKLSHCATLQPERNQPPPRKK